MELFEHIRRDKREGGASIRGLARRHRVHRRTVRQALRSALPPPRKPASPSAPRLGAHRATIREWLVADLSAPRKQRHTARRIWQRLVDERGATVAESTVRAYVGRVRRELESGRVTVTIPQLHPPGEEAEVDFGGVSVWLDGVLTELSMFVMRLSHSGRAVHVCFPGEGQEAFLEGHVIAFERLGGVPRRVRYDNLKAAVTRVLAGRDRIESDRFTALRSHFGFDAFFCEPGIAGAHEKGGVEGEVGRFRRRHLVPVPRVESLAELNALLEAADRADDARHIAGRLATVGRMAEAEQPALRPLPAEPFDPTVALQAKADRKARIAVRGSRYSVPAACAGRTVDVRLGGGTVTALLGGRVLARHERSAHKGAEILVLDHYLEVLSRKPGALPGSSALAQARSRLPRTRGIQLGLVVADDVADGRPRVVRQRPTWPHNGQATSRARRRRNHRLPPAGDASRFCYHGMNARYRCSRAARHDHRRLPARVPLVVNELAEAADERTLSRLVARYGRLDLLCLDGPRGADGRSGSDGEGSLPVASRRVRRECQSLLATNGVRAATPSGKSATNASLTNSGAPRM